MISALTVENFKCFSNLRIPLKPLTLLTGFNGSGKSTSLQPLLLIAQGLRGPSINSGFALNGELVQLGMPGDVLPSNATNKIIRIAIDDETRSVEWELQASPGVPMLQVQEAKFTSPTLTRGWSNVLWPTFLGIDVTPLGDAIRQTVFLSAVRGGTTDNFPVPNLTGLVHSDVGNKGEYAAYWYDKYVDDEIDPAARDRNQPAGSLRKQLDARLNSLFPGAQANVTAFPQASIFNVQFRLSEIGDWRRPANIGYGLTYAFPILVALLTAHVDQQIVIDSPEAHLHPSAQSQMGRILSQLAAARRQIIVETHSDHLLNGVRLAVAKGEIPADSVAIYFFNGERVENGLNVVKLEFDSAGKLDFWPKGFFDQAEEDLMKLAGWN